MKIKLPPTECSYNKSKPIDKLNSLDAISLFVKEQRRAIKVVENQMKSILNTIEAMSEHLKKNKKGRIIYAGAGTSGRLGVQDGVELLPTFGWPKNRINFILAGGEQALLNSIENAEDDIDLALSQVNKLDVSKSDIVIGIAASGNTDFTCKVMKEAYLKNALTVGISNNPRGKILKSSKYKIILNTREELIAGSTRLKAGTSQKVCLNLLSTMTMVKLGFVKNGLMTNLVANNKKLRERKKRIYEESN